MNGHDLRGDRRTNRPRRVELIGGPLDGSTTGEPIEPFVQFILVPTDRPGTGPFPIHTYRLDPTGDRYHYCGPRVQSVPR